jgi:filamentous hemagglutinin family protein
MTCAHLLAWGNPQSPTVVSGEAAFSSGSNALEVIASDRAIIEWKAFSIGREEQTKFILPSSDAAVLNRVTSHLPSSLEGLLDSNGKVYLINPNGVLVSESGVINTSEFFASTLDINNVDFLRGLDLLFAGDSQEGIINRGMITAWNGDVVLIGYKVNNQGEIHAPLGTAALAAGSEVLVTPNADQRITIHIPVIDSTRASQDVGLTQEGVITALQAELKADGNPYALAIQNSGWVNAVTVEKSGGRIFLVAQDGVTSHTGSLTAVGIDHAGGEIQVLGKTVSLTDGASINASGHTGGGSILVGGGYQGQDRSVFNAEQIFIDDSVVMRADAIHSGDGGRVIVWSDFSTNFFGNILVCGGQNSGHGGFVEVSGMQHLGYFGFADRRAPFGEAGTLLLDPSDITISGAADSNMSFVAPNYTATASEGNINVSTLLTNLSAGDVIISSASAFTGVGNITFLDDVDWMTGANTLTLNAYQDILIGSEVTLTNSVGNFVFNAGTGGSGSLITEPTSVIALSGAATLTMTATNTTNPAIKLQGDITCTSNGFITLDTSAVSGSILIGGHGIILDGAAPVSVTSATGYDIQILGASGIDNVRTAPITITSGRNFYLQGEITAFDTISITADEVSVLGNSTGFTGMQTQAGDLNITCNSLVLDTNSSAIVLTGTGSLNVTVNAPGNCLINNGSVMSGAGAPGVGNAANIAITGDLTIQGGEIGLSQITVTGGALSLSTTGDLFVLNDATIVNSTAAATSTITVSGSAYLAAGAGDASIQADTGDLSVTVAGNLNLLSDDTGAATITSTGNLTVTATENIYIIGQPGANASLISTSSGNLTVTATSGNLELTNEGQISLTGGTGVLSFTAGNNLTINNDSSIVNASSMNAVGSVQNNVFIMGGINGDGKITSDQGLTLSTIAATGSINLTAASGGQAFISVGAASSISTAMTGALNMTGLAFSTNAYITSSAGNLTVSAATIDMNNFSNIQIPSGSGILTVNATAGDFRLSNGSYLSNGGTGGISSTVTTGNLHIEGGASSAGGSYIDAGAGVSTITANGIQMMGYSSSLLPFNGARITSSGTLTVEATATDFSMDYFSTVKLTGSGPLGIEVPTGNLLLSNGSEIINSGPATTTVNVPIGFISLIGGVGNIQTSIQGGTGPLNVTSGNNIRMIANINGPVEITTVDAPINVNCGASLLMAGAPESLEATSILTTATITIIATDNVILRDLAGIGILSGGTGDISITTMSGDLSVENGSTISNGGSGTITANIGMTSAGNVLVRAGSGPSNGSSLITALNNGLTMNIPNGNLNIEAVSGVDAFIWAAGTTSITTGMNGKISIMGFSMAFPAGIGSSAGDLTVTGGSLDMKDFSTIILAGTGALTVTSLTDDLRIQNSSSILNSGSGLTTVDSGVYQMVIQSGGDGAAAISGGTGGVAVSAGDLLMTGFGSAPAAISATGGAVNVSTTSNATLAYLSNISLTGGSGTLSFNIMGDLVVNNESTIEQLGSGLVTGVVGGNALIRGGPSGSSTLAGNSTLTFTVGGSLDVQAVNGGSASISSNGAMSAVTVVDKIRINGFSMIDIATIVNGTEDLTVSGSSLEIMDFATISVTDSALGVLTVSATDQDILIYNSSSIENTGISTAVNSQGSVFILGGPNGDAKIMPGIGLFNMAISTGDLNLVADVDGRALIIGSSGIDITVPMGNVLLNGYVGGSEAAIVTDTIGANISITAESNIDVQNNAFIGFTMPTSTGNLTVTTVNGDLTVTNGSSISNPGVGGFIDVESTAGNIIVRSGPAGAATISGDNALTLVAGGAFEMEALSGNDVSVFSGDTSTFTIGGAFLMTGFSPTVQALISSTGGDTTFTVGGVTTLYPSSSILLTDGMGTFTMTLGDDFVLGDDSIIRHFGVGPMIIDITGSATVVAGAGNAIIQAIVSTMNFTTTKNIFVLADETGYAEIVSNGALTVTSSDGSISVIGSVAGNNLASIHNTVGALTVTAATDITLQDGGSCYTSLGNAALIVRAEGNNVNIINNSFIEQQGTGSVTVFADATLLIQAGAQGSAFISGNSTVNAHGFGNLDIIASDFGAAFIAGGNTTTVDFSTGRIRLAGIPTLNPAYIQTTSGDLNVTGLSFDLLDFASINLIAGSGTLNITDLFGECRLSNLSFIRNLGTGPSNYTLANSLFLNGGSAGDASIIYNTVPLILTTSGNIYLQSDLNGGASIFGNASMTVTSSQNISLNGTVAGQPALFTTTSGDLIVSAGGQIVVRDNANIDLTAGSGTLSLLSMADDIVIENNAFLNNGGTGPLSVTSTGNLSLYSGADGAASITGNATVDLTVSGLLDIVSKYLAVATVSANGDSSIQASALNMTGVAGLTPASIQNQSGDLSFVIGANSNLSPFASILLAGGSGNFNMFIGGDLTIINNSSIISNSTTGLMSVLVEGTTNLASGDGNVIVTNAISPMGGSFESMGSIFILADAFGSATIAFAGPASVSSGESIHLLGSGLGGNSASIITSLGNLAVSAFEHITLYDDADIFLTGGSGTLTVEALGGDLLVDNGSNIAQLGTGVLTASAGNNALVKGGMSGNSTIAGNSTVTLTVGGSLDVEAVSGASASISANGPMSAVTVTDKIRINGFSLADTATIVDGTGDLTVSGSSIEVMDFANINITDSVGGILTVTATAEDILIYNNSSIQNAGIFTAVNSQGSIFILGGPDGDAQIMPGNALFNLTVSTGDLNLVADVGGNALITGNSAINIMVPTGNILLNGYVGGPQAAIITTSVISDISITAANNIDIQNNAQIGFPAISSLGNLTVTTVNGDLTVTNDASILNVGIGGFIDVGSMSGNVIVRSGPAGTATIMGNNALTLLAGGAFEIEALSGNGASVTAGSTTTFTIGDAFLMTGFSPAVRALISSTSGDMSFTVGGVTTIYPSSSILLTDGLGDFTMTLGDDFVLGDDSIIEHLGIGLMSIDITGSATVVAGAGNAVIEAVISAMSFTTTKNIFVLADQTGFAQIMSSGNLTVTSSDGSISVIGSLAGGNTASIQNTLGALTVTAATDISLQDHGSILTSLGAGALSVTATSSNVNIHNDAFIEHNGTGSVTVNVGADMLIKAGSDGSGFVSGNSTVDIALGGDLDISANGANSAYISGGDTTNVIASNGRVRIAGDSFLNDAYIQTSGGDLTVTGASFDILDFGNINLLAGSGTFTVNDLIGDFRVSNASFLRNLGVGTTNINAASSLFVTGGVSGDAGLIYTTGSFNLMVAGNINFQADSGGGAFISGNNDLVIAGNNNINIVGEPNGPSSYFATNSGVINVSASNQMVIRDNAFIQLTGGTAGMTVSTLGGDLVVENNAFISNQGTGGQTITANANLTVRAGSNGDAFISGNSTLDLTAGGLLDIESQLLSAATINSNGTTSITANAINMLGSNSLIPATIVNQSGSLTIQTGLATLTSAANITLLGGSGNYSLMCSDDLFVNDGSSLNNLSSGIMNLLVTGSANFIAGAGNSTLVNLGGTLNVSVGNFLNLIADSSGSATFTTSSSSAQITADNVLLSGDPAGVNTAAIFASQGDLVLNILDNISARDNSAILLSSNAGSLTLTATNGDISVQNGSSFVDAGSGSVQLNAGGNCYVIAGFTGPSLIQSNGSLIVQAVGDVNVQAVSNNAASLFAEDSLIIVSNNITTEGFSSTVRATISNNFGDILFLANNFNHLRHSTINLSPNATSLIIALSEDLFAMDDVEVINAGTGPSTVIIADGNITFSGGMLGSAVLLSSADNLTVAATGDVTFNGIRQGSATCTTNGLTATIQSSRGNIYVIGDAAGSTTILTALTGGLNLIANEDIHFYQNVNVNIASGSDELNISTNIGDISMENFVTFGHSGTGPIVISSSGNATFFSGSEGSTIISGNSTLQIEASGNIEMGSRQGGVINVFSNGDTTYFADGYVSIVGYPSLPALASNSFGNFSITGSDVTVANFASVLLTGGNGIFNMQSSTGDINLINNATVTSASTGTMNLNPNFNLNMIAGSGPVLVEATASGSDLILNTSLTQGDLIMIGNATSGPTISINGGDFTAAIAGRATLDNNALIENISGTGMIQMQLSEDLYMNSSNIEHLGTGIINLTTLGDFVLHANSQISGNNDLSMAGNNLLMDAPGMATVQTVNIIGQGTMTIEMSERVILTSNALIVNQVGASGDMIISSGSVSLITGNSGILHRGIGQIQHTSLDSLNLIGGPGDAFIQTSNGDITINVASNLTATSNDSALFATNAAQINANGQVIITANNVLLGGQTTTTPTVPTQFTSNGNMFITAQVNISLRNGSILQNLNSTDGVIVLTADNANPVAPNIGPGHISIDRYSQIINNFQGRHILWYTSAWGERGLTSNVNGGNGDSNFGNFNGIAWAAFFDPIQTPAPTGGGFINIFGVYYPFGATAPVYQNATTAFFYKVNEILPPPPCPPCPPIPAPVPASVVRADLANTAYASSELSFILRMYDWDRFGYFFQVRGYERGSKNAVLRKNSTMWPIEFNINVNSDFKVAPKWKGLEMQQFASKDQFLNGANQWLSCDTASFFCGREIKDAGQINRFLRKNKIDMHEKCVKL